MTDTTPRLLTEADIIAIDDIETEVVEVPEWGGSVKLRGLSLQEVLAIKKGADSSDFAAMGVQLLAASFSDPVLSPEAIEALGKKSARVITRLLNVATRLSGIGDEAVR